MIVDGENKHYAAIKNVSRLLSKLNGKTQHVYHYCRNCKTVFAQSQQEISTMGTAAAMVTPKVNMPSEKEEWLKFHDGQYQLKVTFMLYADFESILKPVDERYREKMNTMKTDRKSKTPYTEKINTRVPSGWCVHSILPIEMFLIH